MSGAQESEVQKLVYILLVKVFNFKLVFSRKLLDLGLVFTNALLAGVVPACGLWYLIFIN